MSSALAGSTSSTSSSCKISYAAMAKHGVDKVSHSSTASGLSTSSSSVKDAGAKMVNGPSTIVADHSSHSALVNGDVLPPTNTANIVEQQRHLGIIKPGVASRRSINRASQDSESSGPT